MKRGWSLQNLFPYKQERNKGKKKEKRTKNWRKKKEDKKIITHKGKRIASESLPPLASAPSTTTFHLSQAPLSNGWFHILTLCPKLSHRTVNYSPPIRTPGSICHVTYLFCHTLLALAICTVFWESQCARFSRSKLNFQPYPFCSSVSLLSSLNCSDRVCGNFFHRSLLPFIYMIDF